MAMPSLDLSNVAPNPAGFASGAAQALNGIRQFKNALNQASIQHQQQMQAQQDAQARQLMQDKIRIALAGGVQVNPGQTPAGATGPTGPVPGSSQASTGGKSLQVRTGATQSDSADQAAQMAQPGTASGAGLTDQLNQASQYSMAPAAPAGNGLGDSLNSQIQQYGNTPGLSLPPSAPSQPDAPPQLTAQPSAQPGGAAQLPTQQGQAQAAQADPDNIANHASHIITLPDGTSYHINTPEEKAAAARAPRRTVTPTGDLLQALQKHIKFKEGESIETEDLLHAFEAAGKIAPTKDTKHYDGTNYNTPAIVNETTNEAAPVKMTGGLTAAPAAADKAPAPHFAPAVLGPHGLPLQLNPKTGKFEEIDATPGSGRQLTPGQEAANAVREEGAATRAQNQANTEADRKTGQETEARKEHNSAYEAGQNFWDMKRQYDGLASGSADRGADPKNPNQTISKAEALARSKTYEARAKQKDKEAATIRQKWGWGEFAPGAKQQQAAPAATPPAAAPKPAQAAPVQAPAPATTPPAATPAAAKPNANQRTKGKLTDQGKAQGYLKKAGGDKVKARALAKADGWEL